MRNNKKDKALAEEIKGSDKKKSSRLKDLFSYISVNTFLCSVIAFILGALLFFFIGTRCGIETGQKIAMQYLEYTAAKPTVIDPDVIKSSPVAAFGDENAPVQVKYFSDLECPSCTKMYEESISKMIKNKDYRVEIYDFPSTEHKYSRLAAKYARCAAEQNIDYFQFVNKIMAGHSEWSSMLKESNVSEYMLQSSVSLGADEDQMNLCVISDSVETAINENIEDGKALGIKGTPSYIIGNGLVQGYVSPETLSKLISEAKNPTEN